MLSLNIPNRRSNIDNEELLNTVMNNTPLLLTDKMKDIAPQGCQLFHGTQISVLQNMLKSQEHPGSLRPFGQLSESEVKTGEAWLQGHIVNDENSHSISTCKIEDIAVPLKYALSTTEEDNYAIIFGINIDPKSDRVKEKRFTDIGAFTDYTVKGNIEAHHISMIMVPEIDEEDVKSMLKGSVLEHVKVTTFESYFEAAAGWDTTSVSNSSYDKLSDVAYSAIENKHFNLKKSLLR